MRLVPDACADFVERAGDDFVGVKAESIFDERCDVFSPVDSPDAGDDSPVDIDERRTSDVEFSSADDAVETSAGVEGAGASAEVSACTAIVQTAHDNTQAIIARNPARVVAIDRLVVDRAPTILVVRIS